MQVLLLVHSRMTSCATTISAMLSGPPTLPPVDNHITREDLHLHKLATMRREARRQQFRIKAADEKTNSNSKDTPDFTEAEIQSVVQFIDSFGNGDGEISLDEITAAFRKYDHENAHRLIVCLNSNHALTMSVAVVVGVIELKRLKSMNKKVAGLWNSFWKF